MSLIQRVLAPVAELRREEGLTALLMFAYSFLAMTVWNAIKPLTRSKFIADLGSDNLPYVLLAAGLVIGVLMSGYAWLLGRLPRRWGLPIVQAGMAGMLVGFWFLFKLGAAWVSVAFYLAGMIFGVLLISQFWTVANLVYDPRQAKRLFGFIGGGAPLGGFAGSALAIWWAKQYGAVELLLPSAALLVVCAALVAWIISREKVETGAAAADVAGKEKGVGFGEALQLLQQSSHLKVIALVISFASIGAAIIEQQLNMAADAATTGSGDQATDAITSFLGYVGLWMSAIGFFVQVWLTSRIHRYLGIGFALLILPVSLGASGVIMLLNAALWAPALARILDQSLRYTVDKTTREILFLPLQPDIKLKAKSFVDVTVDRAAKAVGALMLLVLIKPWGLHLDWQRIGYASLTMVGLWIVVSIYARRGYLRAFRQSIERRDLSPADVRLNAADLSTIETLVQELAHPDPARVVYAIEVLESLDKRNLVTPLLLYHEAPLVRARALRALAAVQGRHAVEWLPQIRRLLGDPEATVRAAAIHAVSAISHEDAATLARPLLADPDPKIRVTAAAALAGSEAPADQADAEATLLDIVNDTSERTARARRLVATAISEIDDPRFRRLLIPLLYDQSTEVADAAMAAVHAAGSADFMFVPTLVSLLRHRGLHGRARAVLVSYGDEVVKPLAHFLSDPEEDIRVRLQIPAILARIPAQSSADALVAALAAPEGALRFRAIVGLERLRRAGAAIAFPGEPIEKLLLRESSRYFNHLTLHDNVFGRKRLGPDTLLGRALEQKMVRAKDRIYRLLSLIYPWEDIAAARWTLERGEARSRASASEYLDNVLTGQLRKRIMPLLEDLPADERVRRANVLLRTRPRDAEETLLQLINDEDQVVAAAAIDVVRQEKMWSLGDDLEHVLAHRDVRDWYVFEAASWALAERRMPAERRRELWREPLPAAELAGRLHGLPLFASVSVEELFRIAGTSKQVRHEAGAVLAQEGEAHHVVHILLDGTVMAGSGARARMIHAPASLGLTETLQGAPTVETLRAEGTAVTLALSAEDLRMLLAENTDLVRGFFTTLVDQAQGAGCGLVEASASAADLERYAADGVHPVEKVLALERVALFSWLSADEARHLADVARTVTLAEGSSLHTPSDGPALWLMLSGEVSLKGPNGITMTAQSGHVVGAMMALAGRTLGMEAQVTRSGVALRIDSEDLFDLMAERPALVRQLFTGVVTMGRRERALATS